MNSMNHSNFQHLEDLYPILNGLKDKANLDGVILAYRDGRIITDIIGTEFDWTNFVSMCASVLESAMGIGETIGNLKINKIIAELEEKTILIFECDTKKFLTLIINRKSDISYCMEKLEEIIPKIKKLN